MKTAQEILSNYDKDYLDDKSYCVYDIISAMEEYASQFSLPPISDRREVTDDMIEKEANETYPNNHDIFRRKHFIEGALYVRSLSPLPSDKQEGKESDQKIIQTDYPNLEFDFKEKDIIQIWQKGRQEINVIQIERKNIIPVLEVIETFCHINEIKNGFEIWLGDRIKSFKEPISRNEQDILDTFELTLSEYQKFSPKPEAVKKPLEEETNKDRKCVNIFYGHECVFPNCNCDRFPPTK